MTTQQDPSVRTAYLTRPEGRLAYDVHDPAGPERGLVLALPGMGDLRTSYRFLAPALAAAGFRVVTADLRGHGDSDSTFGEYGDEATADDVVALLEELAGDRPVTVVGNSMSAGSAVIAAARRPDLVQNLVLVGPFVRDHGSALSRLMLRVVLSPAWAATSWKSYLPSLYKGRRPEDFEDYRAEVVAALRRPGHASAFARTARTRHGVAEAALTGVRARVLVVMGDQDPDFPDAAAEARWIAEAVGGSVVLVDEAGHYPQAQRPDVVNPAVLAFLDGAGDDARGGPDA
jgi:pimeloyl-ACP methyl ester carboxylesterase